MHRAATWPGSVLEEKPDLEYRAEVNEGAYLLHGLRVRSEIPLAERVSAGLSYDVDVRWGQRIAIPAERPPGRLLALRDPDFGGCTIVETESGHTIRFPSECDFRISSDHRSVVVDVAPGFDDGFVPIVLTGNVLASMLGLQGECVLHASGIYVEGWTLAIVGGTGMGKSTLAALLCANGARLVSDDLLRVDADGGRPRCYAGTTQIRLRPKAAELAAEFPPNAREPTADGRIGVTPLQAEGRTFDLDAVLIPLPSRMDEQLGIRRLPKKEALVALLRYPRVLGWEENAPIRRHFEVCAQIAERVAVYEATIPWGPPFAPDLSQALIEELRA
jgi:hypothetical protein